MRFHQVAIYCGSLRNLKNAEIMYKALGYTKWTHDIASLEGEIRGVPASVTAFMSFNYDVLPGIELELLVYNGPIRWEIPPVMGISHISYHVDDMDAEMVKMATILGDPVQTFETHDHTNEVIKGKRRFREVIYNCHGMLGHDIKLIQRIPWGDG